MSIGSGTSLACPDDGMKLTLNWKVQEALGRIACMPHDTIDSDIKAQQLTIVAAKLNKEIKHKIWIKYNNNIYIDSSLSITANIKCQIKHSAE